MGQVQAAERRFLAAPQARVSVEAREGQPAKIEGYGAVFYREGDPGSEYEIFTDLYERILPGAFDEIGDVRSLFNHDSNWVLGRTTAVPATLQLSVDAVGLKYSVTPPDTQAVRDQVLTPIGRGDVSGSSIMFWARKVSWVQETRDGREIEIRQIEKIELLEVGPVTFPAYDSTTAGVRENGDPAVDILVERDAWRDSLRAQELQTDWEAWEVEIRRREAEALHDLEHYS